MKILTLINDIFSKHEIELCLCGAEINPTLTDEFIKNHKSVLEEFKCNSVTTGYELYTMKDTAYLGYLRDCKNNHLIAGGHVILRKNQSTPMPIEVVIKNMIPNQYKEFSSDIVKYSKSKKPL